MCNGEIEAGKGGGLKVEMYVNVPHLHTSPWWGGRRKRRGVESEGREGGGGGEGLGL